MSRYFLPDAMVMSCSSKSWRSRSHKNDPSFKNQWVGGRERFSASILRPPRGLAVKGRTLFEPRSRKPERMSRPPWGRALQGGTHGTMEGSPYRPRGESSTMKHYLGTTYCSKILRNRNRIFSEIPQTQCKTNSS